MRNPCFNPIEQHHEAMRQYEADRDRAEQVSEVCHRCDIAAGEEECEFCGKCYCPRCLELHECFTEQVRDIMREGR